MLVGPTMTESGTEDVPVALRRLRRRLDGYICAADHAEPGISREEAARRCQQNADWCDLLADAYVRLGLALDADQGRQDDGLAAAACSWAARNAASEAREWRRLTTPRR